jgi:glutamine transport system permease protein
MNFRFDLIAEYIPFFLKGALLTIGISILAILCGLILGLFIGIGKLSKNKWINIPLNWYINFFRGTPLVVQLLLVHFGIVPIFWDGLNGIAALTMTLSLNSAAYVAEIFRAGIQSIDRGQMEAARSLGMTHTQSMKEIILPQAFKRMIPPFGNEFIVILKDSSLGIVIAAPELMYWGRAMQGQYYLIWEPYLSVALIYLLLTLSLSRLLIYVERKFATE